MKKIIFGFCLFVSQLAAAQSADQRISTLLNESRWFDLHNQLQIIPPDSLQPVLQAMGTALVKHYFNQPEAACQSLENLLTNYQQEIGSENAFNLACLLGVNLYRLERYQEAADLFQDLAAQLKTQQVDSIQVAGLQKTADIYKMYAGIGNICRPLHLAGEYIIPLSIDNKLHGKEDGFLSMNGRLNRTPKQLIFDTGASMNIISSKEANACGLRKLDCYVGMEGVGIQQGQVAIADTLRIGDTMWQNVPFLIVDIVTGNAEADRIMSKGLAPVIGLPVMLQMKEMQIDIIKQTLTIPASITPNPHCYSNLLLKDDGGLQVEAFDKQGKPVYLHLDTGSSISLFSERWYNNHKNEVDAAGVPDSLRIGGVGGVVQQHSYLMKNIGFQIGTGKARIDSIHIGTGVDLHTNQPISSTYVSNPNEDGVIGTDLLERFAHITINLQDMYIETLSQNDESNSLE